MNSKIKNSHQEQSGSALLSVVGIVFLIAIVAASLVATGRQHVFASVHLRDYVKAQMIAEAGVNQAYNLMKTNFAARLDPNNFPETSFGGGTYDAIVVSGTGANSNKACITSTGVYASATAVSKVDIKNIPLTTTNGAPVQGSTNPYGFSILSGGYLDWAGGSDLSMSNGWMHSNGAYTANGNNTIYGNVESAVSIGMVGGAIIDGTGRAPSISGGTVTTPVVAAVPVLAIPDIDLTPYYNAALANNQVFSGGKILSGTVAPQGGIMWVNGSMTIQEGTYSGSFIATGAIEVKTASAAGSIVMNKVNQYPVLASRDGSILVKQAKALTFNGLVYCKTGSFNKSGNGDVTATGAIIAAGNVTKNGGWTAMIYSDPTPIPPGGSNLNSKDRVIITAWQQ